MFINIIIVILSLVILVALHELGHFLIAKKLGMKVEEFGIGYPPRIFGKKIGETIYSLNLLPFGAFVKILGEEDEVKNKRSFSSRPIWQRAAVVLGGVVFFWIIAFVLFSAIAGIWGLPTAAPSDYEGESAIRILQVKPEYPAKEAGIKIGDEIVKITNDASVKPQKVETVQNFISSHTGEKITIQVKRGDKILDFSLIPKETEEGKGLAGISLAKVANIKIPWYKAPIAGATITAQKTIQIPVMLSFVLSKSLKGERVEGVEVSGPVGIVGIMGDALSAGLDNFLMFMALISVWLAIFNILPIPALDGGKLLFLIIEKVKGKPVSPKVEQRVTVAFFSLLLALMVIVTVKDIMNLF